MTAPSQRSTKIPTADTISTDAEMLTIGTRRVGAGQPCFIIAEIGTNHDRSLEKALHLVRTAAGAGVDAVKFQLYEADDIVSHRILPSEYGLDGLYGDATMHEVFDRHLRTPREWFPDLRACARDLGVAALSTVHSADGAVFVGRQGLDAIKLASMDFNNIPVLEKIVEAATVPLIFSTGISDLDEIDQTVAMVRRSGKPFALLHCVATYPARFEELHLQNIDILRRLYRIPVGFSDHSVTTLSAAIAVAAGASIIEKHVTLSRADRGPDHPFALEPDELKRMVEEIRNTEAALKPRAGFTGPSDRELLNQKLYRRSLVAARPIVAGRVIASDDIKITRPGSGIAPKHLGRVVGRTARRAIEADTPITWDMV